MLPAPEEKGEFETTEEFEARVSAASFKLDLGILIVETNYDRSEVMYDADNSRFEITKYAWGNTAANFSEIFRRGNRFGLPPVSITDELDGLVHGEGLSATFNNIRTYPASNAMGAVIQVTEREVFHYSIYDRRSPIREETWDFDFSETGSYIDGNHRAEGVFLSIPRDRAKDLKSALRFGIVFSPKAPYLVVETSHEQATFQTRTESHEYFNVIIGDMKCLVITDVSGDVLRTVDTTY